MPILDLRNGGWRSRIRDFVEARAETALGRHGGEAEGGPDEGIQAPRGSADGECGEGVRAEEAAENEAAGEGAAAVQCQGMANDINFENETTFLMAR